MPTDRHHDDDTRSTVDIGDLRIEHGPGTLAPRPWTVLHGDWAVELAGSLPDGGVLELCAGVGHIGLVVAHRTARRLVQVDDGAAACRYARRNALVNGLAERVEVRRRDLGDAVAPGERFPLVLADPPYVPSGEVARFPEDPPDAIDGGPDGLAVARRCLAVCRRALSPGGAALVQLRDPAQAEALATGGGAALRLDDVRTDGPERAVALFRR